MFEVLLDVLVMVVVEDFGVACVPTVLVVRSSNEPLAESGSCSLDT